MDSEIFEKLPPTKLFFRCAIPSMITMAFSALYQIADGLFVGRFIGEDALAAVNLIMPIIMMVFAFSSMIATGASVRIAVLLGEKNREEASRVFTYSLKFIFFSLPTASQILRGDRSWSPLFRYAFFACFFISAISAFMVFISSAPFPHIPLVFA